MAWRTRARASPAADCGGGCLTGSGNNVELIKTTSSSSSAPAPSSATRSAAARRSATPRSPDRSSCCSCGGESIGGGRGMRKVMAFTRRRPYAPARALHASSPLYERQQEPRTRRALPRLPRACGDSLLCCPVVMRERQQYGISIPAGTAPHAALHDGTNSEPLRHKGGCSKTEAGDTG